MCDKSETFLSNQYNALSNEYNALLQGSQNVIIINLAISIGILGAMATLINGELNDGLNMPLIFFSLLSFTGLVGSICCIRTIHYIRNSLIMMQDKLMDMEKEIKPLARVLHKAEYFKPLHITLVGFWMFFLTFLGTFSVSFAKIILPKYQQISSIIITAIIVILIICVAIIISNYLYEIVNNRLLRKIK